MSFFPVKSKKLPRSYDRGSVFLVQKDYAFSSLRAAITQKMTRTTRESR